MALPRTEASIPPSPTSSEDLTQARFDGVSKGKQREQSDPEDNAEYTSYPPQNDQETETRRVQENLKRWEIAERQRRKAARDSVAGVSSGSSILSDVGKMLWRDSSQKMRPTSNHTALQSTDSLDTLPLKSVSSPEPTSTTFENPFLDPTDNEPNNTQQTAVMLPATQPPTPAAVADHLTSPTPDQRPTIVASSSSFSNPPPPPRPLDLPPPKTPPPRISTPANSESEPQEEKETRWWHDWLCGCSEGPDRGGDNQAGRTNPFE